MCHLEKKGSGSLGLLIGIQEELSGYPWPSLSQKHNILTCLPLSLYLTHLLPQVSARAVQNHPLRRSAENLRSLKQQLQWLDHYVPGECVFGTPRKQVCWWTLGGWPNRRLSNVPFSTSSSTPVLTGNLPTVGATTSWPHPVQQSPLETLIQAVQLIRRQSQKKRSRWGLAEWLKW